MKKRILIYTGVLTALVLLYLPTVFFSVERRQAAASSVPLLRNFEGEEVHSLELEKNQSVRLSRVDGVWAVINDGIEYPARQEKVSSFIETLFELKRTREVGSSDAVWSTFGVPNDGEALVLKNQSGQVLARLYCGNSSADGRGVYVRLEGTETVYSVDNSFLPYFSQSVREWYDLGLFPEALNAGSLTRISRSLGDEVFTMVSESSGGETQWVDSERLILDQEKAGTLARTLVDTDAYDFETTGTIGDEVGRFSFEDTSGQRFELLLYSLTGEDYYPCRISGSPYTYLIDNAKGDILIRPAEEMYP